MLISLESNQCRARLEVHLPGKWNNIADNLSRPNRLMSPNLDMVMWIVCTGMLVCY